MHRRSPGSFLLYKVMGYENLETRLTQPGRMRSVTTKFKKTINNVIPRLANEMLGNCCPKIVIAIIVGIWGVIHKTPNHSFHKKDQFVASLNQTKQQNNIHYIWEE